MGKRIEMMDKARVEMQVISATPQLPFFGNKVEVFGEEKIMMGSDFLYFRNEKYVRAADYIRNADLSNEVKEKF